MSAQPPRRKSTTRGFTRTASLLTGRVRDASASRGFAQSRLLTQWAEIAGEAVAQISRPVEVTYARGGFGATLVVLTTGPNAPMLEMEKEKLRAKVNAVYGYNAVARIRITQTAPTGFAEGQADFTRPAPDPISAPNSSRRAVQVTDGIESDTLREALSRLGSKILHDPEP